MSLSLADAYQAASRRAEHHKAAYLSGFMGLTGISAGFALETAERVQKGLTLFQDPTPRTQLLEKLLIKAVFQTIGPADDWREICCDWDPELVTRVQMAYWQLTQQAVGARVQQRIPEQRYASAEFLPWVMQNLDKAGADDHYFIVFSNPKETLYAWHVVYFHPQKAILADGANCLVWESQEKTKKVFLETAAEYFKEHYSYFKEFHILKGRVQPQPARCHLMDKIALFFSTLYAIGRYSLSLAARFAAATLLPHCIAQYLFINKSAKEEHIGVLTKQAKAGDFDAFIATLQDRGHRRFDLTFSSISIEGDPRRYFPLLEKLGPEFEDVSAAIQKSMWDCLCRETNEALPPEKEVSHRQAVQRLLGHRARMKEKYCIHDVVRSYCGIEARHPYLEEFFKHKEFGENRESILESPQCACFSGIYMIAERGPLQLLQLAVQYGANPHAPFYPKGDTPLDAAKKSGKLDVVQYLESLKQ